MNKLEVGIGKEFKHLETESSAKGAYHFEGGAWVPNSFHRYLARWNTLGKYSFANGFSERVRMYLNELADERGGLGPLQLFELIDNGKMFLAFNAFRREDLIYFHSHYFQQLIKERVESEREAGQISTANYWSPWLTTVTSVESAFPSDDGKRVSELELIKPYLPFAGSGYPTSEQVSGLLAELNINSK